MKAFGLVVSFAACAALLAAPAAFAERLDAAAPLGTTTTSSVASPTDVATIGFLVTQGTARKMSFLVKRTKGSTLTPDVRLVAPDGSVFDIAAGGGSATPSTTGWKAKLPNVPQTGLWRVEVRGANGTSGGFTLAVKGSDTAKSAGTPAPIQVNGKQDVEIVAGENAALSVSVKRASGSRLVPQLTVIDPNGVPFGTPFVGSSTKGTLSVKSLRLPLFGKYTLRFSGAMGSGGGFSYSASTAPAKVKGTLPLAVSVPAFEVEPGMEGKLDGSSSQPGSGGALAYRWAQVGGPAVTLTGAATSQPTFTAPVTDASLAFQLSVTENGLLSKSATVAVEVAKRPIADAGRSQSVISAAAVTLDGSASTIRRAGSLGYAWRQVPGDDVVVTLAGAATASPTFTAPAGNHTLHFGLVVDDGTARSFEDVVVVEVGTAHPAVADAGREQYVSRMASVHLCGVASRTATGVLDAGLQWTQVSGPAVTLAGATTPWPSFTAPRNAGDLVFELTAGGDPATADRVAVRVRPTETNLPPNAKVNGPLNAASGPVPMAATPTTDVNADAISFRWAQVAGAPVPVADASTATATATIPAGNAQYGFAVMANDGLQYGSPDLVSVRNSGYTGLPVAVAGPDRSANPGATVSLDGRGSSRTDGGAGALTYQWTQVSGKDWFDVTTSTVVFNPAAAFAQFALPADVSSLTPTRTIVMQLVVNDGTSASQPDFVVVTFGNLPLNGKPAVTAQATPANPFVGQTVTLQATATDRDGDPMTFKWTQTAGPNVTLSPNATSLAATFVAPDTATPIRFTFAAKDAFDETTSPVVTVTVDRKPVANIVVSPTQGSPGTFVTMDGTSSSDPEGAQLTYRWTQTSGTAVSFNSTASVINFNAPVGAVGFRLVVNDGKQDSDPKSAGFSGNPPPTVTASVSNADTSVMGSPSLPAAAYGSTTATLVATPGTGGPFTYTWRQIDVTGSDPVCTLSSTTAQNPTITVPMPTTAPFGVSPQVRFGVRASDGIQSSAESTVDVKLFASLNNGTNSQGSTVYSIITSRCISCHSGSSTTGGCPIGSGSNASNYAMGTKSAFLTNSRGHSSCGSGSKSRLPSAGTTGASGTNAYFWDRIRNGGTGPQMPTNGGSLTTTEQNFIQDWIDQGVQDN